MNKIKPILPDEVVSKKLEIFPDNMLESVNELIAKHWDGYSAHFKQKELEDLYLEKCKSKSTDVNFKIEKARQEMYDNHWMDFEDIYRNSGWKVEYDKPGYNESYEATFEFKRKKEK